MSVLQKRFIVTLARYEDFVAVALRVDVWQQIWRACYWSGPIICQVTMPCVTASWNMID